MKYELYVIVGAVADPILGRFITAVVPNLVYGEVTRLYIESKCTETAWETIVQNIMDTAESDPQIFFCAINHVVIDGERYDNETIFPYYDEKVKVLYQPTRMVPMKEGLRRVFEELDHFELGPGIGVNIISKTGRSPFKVGADGSIKL